MSASGRPSNAAISEAVDEVVARKVPRLRANEMNKDYYIQYAGQAWKEVLFNMPQGMTIDDVVNEASVAFCNVQSKRDVALTKMDVVHLLNFEGDKLYTMRVKFADNRTVRLTKPQVQDLGTTESHVYEDEQFRAMWHGPEIIVTRKSNGVQVGRGFTHKKGALDFIAQQYPKQVGGMKVGA